MKAKDLAQLLEVIVRKVVREELKPIITEVRNASKPLLKETKKKTKRTSNRIQKDPLDINLSEILSSEPNVETKSENKSYVKNPMLNEMLNDVAASGEWRNMDGTFNSNQAQSFMQGGSTSVAPATDIDGRPVDTSNEVVANVMGSIKKDYSQLMKAIDKKKGR